MSEKQLRQEIQRKKARVAYLCSVVRDNLPIAGQRFADGYFTTAAESFRWFAAQADEIATLNGEITQLGFELDRPFPVQTEHPALVPA